MRQNVLTKIAQDGSRQKQYSDAYQMPISQIDVLDPMNIMVYFEQDNRVVFLDNNLNEIRPPVFLENYNINEPTIVARSSNYWLWIFDPYELRFFSVDKDLALASESKDISHFVDEPYTPTFVREFGNYLFVNVPSSGICVFDMNGAFVQKHVYPNVKANDIQFIANDILLKVGKNLFLIDLKMNKQRLLELPDFCQQVRLAENATYLCSDGKSLKRYAEK